MRGRGTYLLLREYHYSFRSSSNFYSDLQIVRRYTQRLTEWARFGTVVSSKVVAELVVCHVVPPLGRLFLGHGEAEALRTQREIIDGQLGLGTETVRTHDLNVVSGMNE
jgi:hypothetical protein